MPLEQLTGGDRVSPFTPQDRIDHMAKQVQRTFGVEASELGTIESDGDRAVLVVEHAGKTHRLTWKHGQRGVVNWYVDDSDRPLLLAGGNNPLARLRASLEA